MTPSPQPPLKGENALTPDTTLPGFDAVADPSGAVVLQIVQGQEGNGEVFGHPGFLRLFPHLF